MTNNSLFEKFADWLDAVPINNLPENAAAINFNIYEEIDSNWSVQLIASERFDPDDEDWACDEIFTTGEELFRWQQESEWEEILEVVKELVGKYLDVGKYAENLKKYRAVAVGFVDGNLEILYINNS